MVTQRLATHKNNAQHRFIFLMAHKQPAYRLGIAHPNNRAYRPTPRQHFTHVVFLTLWGASVVKSVSILNGSKCIIQYIIHTHPFIAP